MSRKRVLLVTYYWPPSGGAGVQRILKFVKYLTRFGVEPFVLTVENPTYSITDPSLEKDIPDDLKVFKSRSPEPFNLYSKLTGKTTEEIAKPTIELGQATRFVDKVGRWIRANIFIPDARVGWLTTARSKALEIATNYDIEAVLTSGPPHSVHFTGKYLQDKLNLHWITDFRDPWTDIFYNRSLPRSLIARKIDRYLEKKVLKNADDVLVVSPSMKKMQNRIYKRNYHVIPNGFDHEDFMEMTVDKDSDSPFTIRHVGSISEASVPHGFFRALEELPGELNFILEFIGNVHPTVEKWIRDCGIDKKVTVKPYLPHQEAIEAMVRSDLLLLVIPDTKHNELILTGKLFEYIGSRTPVMLIGPKKGDACRILQETGNGKCFEHNDIESMKNFIDDSVSNGNIPQLESANAGHKIVYPDKEELKKHPYSRYTLTKKLAQIINS